MGHHGASGGIPMYDRWKYWTKRQISVVSGVAASAEREAGKAPDGVGHPSEERRVKRAGQFPVGPKLSGNQSLTNMDPQYALGGRGIPKKCLGSVISLQDQERAVRSHTTKSLRVER